MIKDIKDVFCTAEVYNIYSSCMFEPTFEKFKAKAVKFRKDSSISEYGYFRNGKIVGVIATQEKDEEIEILGIAVGVEERYSGIGTKLINFIRKNSKKKIIAETDSDAVLFYKKYGFNVHEVNILKSELSYRRYICSI